MMSNLIAVVLLFTPLGVTAPSCWVLHCLVPEVHEAVEKADAVFIGEVTEVIEPAKPVNGGLYTIRFRAEKTFKGFPFSERSILSAQGQVGSCGYTALRKGERYLVYAEPLYKNDVRAKGPLRINACSRTALLPGSGPRLSRIFENANYEQSNGWEDLKALAALPVRRVTAQPLIKIDRIFDY